jgi:curved DNA-binding protein CbpA
MTRPQMMQRINEAYEVLNNPLKRKKYDAGLVLAASLKDNTHTRRTLLTTFGDRLKDVASLWQLVNIC